MKDSALRRQILEDVLGEKVDEYENFHKSKLTLNKRQHRKLIPLWKFLLHLLSRDKKSSYIEWSTERTLEFRILDTQSVAELWGSMKNKTDMTYEKLGRAMRYYYGKSIIEKVNGKRYSYRFILSRRTKKYISQFINIKGMKVEPIDPRVESPDLNSDSASIGSTAASEEDEVNSLYDTSSSSTSASPASPTIRINVKTIKPVSNGQTKTNRRGVRKADVCMIRSDNNGIINNNEHSAFVVPHIVKTEEVDETYLTEEIHSRVDAEFGINQSRVDAAFDRNQSRVDAVFDRNQSRVDAAFDRNQSLVDSEFYKNQSNVEAAIGRNHSLVNSAFDRNRSYNDTPLQMEQENPIDDKPAILSEIQLYTGSINNNKNQADESGFHSLQPLNEKTSRKIFLLRDEYDDSDLSSLTGSVSSDDFDTLEYIDIDYLETGFDKTNLKSCDGEAKTTCQVVENKQQDMKLNRQIDPFMGCDFVRLAECDRSNFDMSFSDIFEEYLF